MSSFEVIQLSHQQLPARTATRAPLGTGVKLQFDDAVDVVNGTCENISIGGIQVIAEEPRPQGTLVRFELDIEDGLIVRGLGEVVWMRARSSGGVNEPGMGIKFRFIEQRDRQVIFKLVSEHIKERLAQKHPGMEEPAPAVAAATLPAPPTVLEEAPTVTLQQPAPPSPAPSERPLKSIEQLMASQDADSSQGRVKAPATDLDQSFLTLQEQSLTPPAPASPTSAPTPVDTARLDTQTYRSPPPPESATADWPLQVEDLPGEGHLPSEGPLDDDETANPRVRPDDLGYVTDELYRPRAARRRGLPLIPIILLLLAGGCLLLYFYWDQIVGPSAPPPSTDSQTAAESTANESPTAQVDEASTPANSAPSEATPPSSAETNSLSTAVSTSSPSPPPPPVPPPPPPPVPPQKTAALRPFTQVLGITSTRLPGGVKIVIETNGSIADSRFSHFRLKGENPREVVKLKGVIKQFSLTPMAISGSPVNQVRVGYHPGPKELHIVLDMRDRSTHISQIRVRGKKLEVQLE